MDTRGPAKEMHALSRRDEGSECDDLRTCVLLGVYCGLGKGEARVSALSAECVVAACACAEGVKWEGRTKERTDLERGRCICSVNKCGSGDCWTGGCIDV